jgi:hypothetical protein
MTRCQIPMKVRLIWTGALPQKSLEGGLGFAACYEDGLALP